MNSIPEIPITEAAKARFESKLLKTQSEQDCWPYRGQPSAKGYGRFRIKRIEYRPHRVAYTIANGQIPEGMVVRHTCDNPMCCNPAHLALGTQNENMRDMRLRDRQPKKISIRDAAVLVATYESGVPHGWYKAMAEKFKVSKLTIERIVKGKARKNAIQDAKDLGIEFGVMPNNIAAT